MIDRLAEKQIDELKKRIEILEIKLKHVQNDLFLTREENDTTTQKYLEFVANLEEIVYERTQELNESKRNLELKGNELQMMLDASPALIFYKDVNLRFRRVNRVFANFLGVSVQDIIGKTLNEIIPQEEYIEKHARTVLTTGDPVMELEERIKTFSGLREIKIDRFPERNAENEIIGIIGFGLDVTEENRSKEEKLKLEELLSRAQKMESLGLLAGGVAHDLNGYFTPLLGYAELLLMKMENDNPHRKAVRKIKESTEDASEMVQDLLTLARRSVKKRDTLSINHIVQKYIDSPDFNDLKEENPDIEVVVNLQQELLNMKGSTSHLLKSMMNLIKNAIEAMHGNGKLIIETFNQYVDTEIANYDRVIEGDYVVVRIADTGVGIEKDDLKRIFEPFYTKKKMGKSGSGLGMAVVWGTIKDHMGYIDVTSSVGIGTTFTLYFPATRDHLETEEDVNPFDYMGDGEAILVIDDVESQRDIAQNLLEQMNYEVITCESGFQAVEVVKKREIDLVILDMILENSIDGLDTYKEILKIRPGQKAIIVSGAARSERVDEALRLGAGAYIKKPYTLKKIGTAILDEIS